MAQKVACIGVGNIGRAWAIVFSRAGYEVALFDVRSEAVDAAMVAISTSLAELEKNGLIQSAQSTEQNLKNAHSMEDAVRGAHYVQESVIEDLDVKQNVFQVLDELTKSDTILASSTSEIPGSHFMKNLKGRARCVVAHPVNPPYLIPLVELCATPWTSEETIAGCHDILTSAGQVPITVNREISGFILNRLQYALVAEALHLVGENYCSVEDLDKAIKNGLGLRWAFMGPFETGHLNADGGYAEYMEKFGPTNRRIMDDLKVNYGWDDNLIRRIHNEVEKETRGRTVADGQRWRDRCLMALRKSLDEIQQTDS